MLREHYENSKLFEEILQLLPKMDPALAKIDTYLEDEELFLMVRADLARRRKLTLVTGQNSTPVEVVERMLVVKRLYGYSYEETERYVRDSLVLRQFCRVYLNAVPDDTTLIKWANLIRDETLYKFNERVTQIAMKHQVTKVRKVGTDGTVVESNIHHPCDNRQLADSVRVLERTIQRVRQIQQDGTASVENVTKVARNLARKIGETLKKRTEEAKEKSQKLYQE